MKYRSKRISTSFTVILVLLAIIIAGFFYKYFTRSKPKTIPVIAIAAHPHKKHKRKHRLKKLVAANYIKHTIDTVKNPAVNKPVLVKPITPVKVIVAAPIVITKPAPVKPRLDTIKAPKPNNDFLYATYVQPNVTGVVKMRAQDKFYSNIVADIPANSKVFVLEKGATYYKVAYNTNIGFVPKWTLQIK